MSNYLGEIPVDTATHPEFKSKTPLNWALDYIRAYGGIDGAHHKDWVLDQVTRILLGTPILVTEASWDNGRKEFRFNTGEPSEAYLAWVRETMAGEDGPETYSYNVGIAP